MTNPKHTDTSGSGDLVALLDCDCDSDHCTFKMAKGRIEALEAEVKRLREALIKGGPTAGGYLPDTVSTGFLMLVPEEVSAKIKQQYNGKIYLPLKDDHDAAKRAALGEKDKTNGD